MLLRRYSRFGQYGDGVSAGMFQTSGSGSDAVTGWLTQAKEGTVSIVQGFFDLVNPDAAQARRKQEIELQQQIAAQQQSQAQMAYLYDDAARSRASVTKWLIGGVVVLGGGLVFAKMLRH